MSAAGKAAAVAGKAASAGAGKAASAGAGVLTDSAAKRYVLAGVAGTGVITTFGVVKRTGELPEPRLLAGVAIAGASLALVAEYAPRLAAGLATLLLLTAAVGLSDAPWVGVRAITRPTS